MGRFSLYKRKSSELWLVCTTQNYGWCAQHKIFCRSLFKQLQILPVLCQCILSVMKCIFNNQEIVQTNSSIHNINTSNKHHHHRPNTNQSCFRRSSSYAVIKIFKFTTQCDNPQEWQGKIQSSREKMPTYTPL